MCLIKNTRTNRRTQEHLFSRVATQTHSRSRSQVLPCFTQSAVPLSTTRRTSSPMNLIISPLLRQLNRSNCYFNTITSRNVSVAVIGSGPSGFYLTQALIKVSVLISSIRRQLRSHLLISSSSVSISPISGLTSQSISTRSIQYPSV